MYPNILWFCAVVISLEQCFSSNDMTSVLLGEYNRQDHQVEIFNGLARFIWARLDERRQHKDLAGGGNRNQIYIQSNIKIRREGLWDRPV